MLLVRLDLLLLDDVLERLLADVPVDAPRSEYMSLIEDLVDLLQRTPGCLGEAEQVLYERRKVERAEDEVRLVCNARQTRGYGPREGKVEQPIQEQCA